MEEISYKEKKIEIEESAGLKVSIDGQSVHVSEDVEAKEFNSGELPYRSFKSLKELAEAIVDQRLQSE